MVRIVSSFAVLLSLAAVGLSTPFKRAVADIEADIATLSTKVTALDNAINAFPLTGGTLIAALNIHTSAAALVAPLQNATADVIATGPLGEDDGATILADVEAFTPTIQDALTGIVTKKPAFVALPVGGLPSLILIDLTNLKSNTSAFADSLISTAPADLTANATALRDSILSSFDTAIAAYSS